MIQVIEKLWQLFGAAVDYFFGIAFVFAVILAIFKPTKKKYENRY
ncbi:MAG: hypothetical protein ABUT20_39905 [Bacteroidota bacterium]